MSLDELIRDRADPLLTPKEAARRLGITTQTLRQWARDGSVEYERVGKKQTRRYRRSEIERQRTPGNNSCST